MSFVDPPVLPGFLERQLPFQRRAFEFSDGQTMHFIDHGSGRPVLLMHGNPTYSYLYRKMVPGLAAGGFRVIVPDLLGFGFSDKPRSVRFHRLHEHVERVRTLVDALTLDDLVIFGQDWGGPIAVGVAARIEKERTTGAVLANTAILKPARPLRTKGFHRFSHLPVISDVAFRGLLFPVPTMFLVQGDRSSIGLKQMRAYAHPFRMPWNRSGPLGLARMVPNTEDHPSTPVMDEIGAWAETFSGPVRMVWGLRDPVLGRSLRRHRAVFPNAPVVETDAGHFIQEEKPDLLVEAITNL